MSKSKRTKRPRTSKPAAGAAVQIDESKLFEAVSGDEALADFLLAATQAAEQYRLDRIRQATRKAMRHYQSTGRRMSSDCPYGWQLDPDNPKMMIVNPAEVEVVGRVVALRAEGFSWNKISRRMEFEGYEPRKGGAFRCATLQRIVARATREVGEKNSAAGLDER